MAVGHSPRGSGQKLIDLSGTCPHPPTFQQSFSYTTPGKAVASEATQETHTSSITHAFQSSLALKLPRWPPATSSPRTSHIKATAQEEGSCSAWMIQWLLPVTQVRQQQATLRTIQGNGWKQKQNLKKKNLIYRAQPPEVIHERPMWLWSCMAPGASLTMTRISCVFGTGHSGKGWLSCGKLISWCLL
jgi:hypothetical protein